MVIDAGEEEDGYEIVNFLESKGINKINKLIITHYDKDHVGGADTLLEFIDVEEIILPDYIGVGTEYLDFMKALENKEIEPTYLHENYIFNLGDATITVEPPSSYEISKDNKEVDNDLSLITIVEHYDNRLVFLGDAEKLRLREWLNTASAIPCDFLKLPHHGVYNTELDNLVNQLNPKNVAICTSNKNVAETQTIQLLKSSGAKVAETKDGDIIVSSDGKNVYMNGGN